MRGFAAIGLHQPKDIANIGGVIRAAFCYEASLLAIAGDRAKANAGVNHGTNTMKGERHMPVIRGDNLHDMIPHGCIPIAVDLVEGACPLHSFQHPISAFYVFGPEDGTIGKAVLDWCKYRVFIPTRECMNLAATVNVVLYDRQAKFLRAARKELVP